MLVLSVLLWPRKTGQNATQYQMLRASSFARVLTLAILPCLALATSDTGLAAYKAADFETAIPLLRAACSRSAKDPVVHAALLSSLVHEGRVDDASDAAEEAAADFPDSPDVLAARGEFAYYMGDMPEAERLFKAAAVRQDQTARAYYGLFRLCRAASLYRTARHFALRSARLQPPMPGFWSSPLLIAFSSQHSATPTEPRP